MRSRLAGFWIAALLLGCAHHPANHDDDISNADILDYSISALNRLDRIAAPIMRSNHDLCPQTRADSGIRTHRLSDYPEALHDAARTERGLDGFARVRIIIPGSAADALPIEIGDRVIEDAPKIKWQSRNNTAQTAIISPDKVCDYGLEVIFSERVNGHSDLDTVFVTSGLLDTIADDVNLALIIAHELGHVIKGHRPEDGGKPVELLADRLALVLMVRAGLDIDRAISYWQRAELTEPAMHDAAATHPSVAERLKNFNETRDKIRAAQRACGVIDFSLLDQ